MKKYLTSLVIRKCKLRPQRNTTTRSVEWIKLKHLTIPSIDKNVQQLELSYNAAGNVNSSIILKNCLGVSYEVKHTMTL